MFGRTMSDLRDVLFIRVTQNTLREISVAALEHLHALGLRFHLQRKTGGMLRAIDRGQRGVGTVVTFLVFTIIVRAQRSARACSRAR